MWSKEEKAKFYELMAMVSENYGREYSQALLKGWEQILSKYPFKDVEKAILQYVMTQKFAPKLADIIELVKNPAAVNKEKAELLAEQAWAEVLEQIEALGAYTSVKFKDPIVNAVIKQLGGWVELCKKTYQELMTQTKWDFKKLYVAYAMQGQCPEVKYLPGILEITNSQKGYENRLFKEVGQRRIEIETTKPEEQQIAENIGIIEDLKNKFEQ